MKQLKQWHRALAAEGIFVFDFKTGSGSRNHSQSLTKGRYIAAMGELMLDWAWGEATEATSWRA